MKLTTYSFSFSVKMCGLLMFVCISHLEGTLTCRRDSRSDSDASGFNPRYIGSISLCLAIQVIKFIFIAKLSKMS